MSVENYDNLYGNVKLYVIGKIVLKTALHIGTGLGDLRTDSVVMKTKDGLPFIPGSSMKGVLRSAVDSLCEVVTGEIPCFLEQSDSGDCTTANHELFKKYNDLLEDKVKNKTEIDKMLDEKRCLSCKLFGSPVFASKIFIADLHCNSENPDLRIRDGVGIDRDTETARDGVKFDFETVSPETSFKFEAIVDKPEKLEAKILAVGLREMEMGGLFLGGNTSRGLGRFRLEIEKLMYLPYERNAIINYLINADPINGIPKVANIKEALDYLISLEIKPKGEKI